MTGHKKRFCSFETWTRITSITKTTASVRSVARENTHPDVSVVKSVLRRTQKASADNMNRRLRNREHPDYQT